MGAAHNKDFEAKTGLTLEELSSSNLVKVDQNTKIISFFPTKSKGPNYKKLSSRSQTLLTSEEIKETVLIYTNHETGYCTTINLLLASDGSNLLNHSEFIMKLDYSIQKLAYKYPCKNKKTYRGLWLTETEFESYLEGDFQYIPSFLSTSRNPDKFYKSKGMNCLMVFRIECYARRAFEVGKEFSKYEKEEEETLFGCYNKFKVEKKMRNMMFKGECFEFGIELQLVNEDLGIGDAKILGIMSCF